VLSFQPEPIQRYSNDKDQNGANNDYRFDFPKQCLSELVGLRDEHLRIPLDSADLFKSFSFMRSFLSSLNLPLVAP